MNKAKPLYWLAIVILTGLLNACGGGGGSDGASGDSTAALTSVTSGVAVDPYIVGAYLEEVSADGTKLIQSSLAPTDVQGRFNFRNPVTEGSIIRLKASARGMHGNAPYTGMLKHKASIVDDRSAVISPLTTLVANGMSEDDVTTMMADAGLPGLTVEDIYTDPIAGLENRTTGVNDAILLNLQANMAANAYMEATGNFNYNGSDSSAASLQMRDMVEAVQLTLNAELFDQLATQVGNGFVLGDLINTAAQLNRTIVSQTRQEMANGGQQLTSNRIRQIVSGAMADAVTIAKNIYEVRNADDAIVSTPDPVTPPTTGPITPPTDPGTNPTPPVVQPPQDNSGQIVYDRECAGCHKLSTHDTSGNIDLFGMGSVLISTIGGGHMGKDLSPQDLSDLSGFADTFTPPVTDPVTPPVITDPVTPQTGEELYIAECQGCHGSLQTTRISNRTAAGTEAAISGDVGGMGSILLSPAEIQLIADSMPAPQPPPVQPPQYRNGQAVYDQDCSGCHKLGTHDPVGNIDLSGLGSPLVTKLEGGHMGKNLPSQEVSALADFADTFNPPAPPVVPRNSQTVYNENCAGCHKINGYDATGNIDLAGLGSSAATKVPGGHGGSVSTEELTNLAAWLDSWAPVPPPVIARDGKTVYDNNCAGCHKLYGYDPGGNIDLASTGGTAVTKLGAGHGGTLSAEEVTNVANWLDTWTPAPPPVVDRSGETLYNDNCAACHKLYGYDAAGNIDLAGTGNIVPAKLGTGHGGTTTSGEVSNLSNWLNTWTPQPPPVVARNGETIYTENCATCHKLYGYDANGNIDLASMGHAAIGKLATGHGGAVSNEEGVNLADWLDSWAPAPPPVVDRTGQIVYDDNCAGCHKLYGYDTVGNIDLASTGNAAITKLGTGHGGAVSPGEVSNIANWLDIWAPAPPPIVDRTGQLVYDDNCAGCHKLYGYDSVGNIDLASMGNTTVTKLGTGHGGTVSTGEVSNIANWLDSWAPAPPPVVTRNGETVYNDNCGGCHKVNSYDANGSIDLAGQGALIPTKLDTGHGGTVSAAEQTNLVNWLNTFQASDPYAGACDSCHGQPPAGNTFPDTVGSHDVHTALNDLTSNCAACHSDAAHNYQIDRGIATVWNAKSGTATGNSNNTCSNISCHGGRTTPVWDSGSINVDTQCSSCHSYGTSQYNGYYSGEHNKHVRDKGYACSACHDVARLRNGHFTNLETRTFEQAPSATIKSSLSYSGGRCSTASCHGGESW